MRLSNDIARYDEDNDKIVVNDYIRTKTKKTHVSFISL